MKKQKPPTPKCGAKNRQGEPCGHSAGWGTTHRGEGRCRLHGGATPCKHGRYSKVKRHALRSLIEDYEADPDPLNILPELAAARALFQDFIERYDEWRETLLAWHESFNVDADGEQRPAKPRQVLDIGDAYRILSEVTKIVKRIEDIRSQNSISRPEAARIWQEMGRVVELYVRDETVLERIRDGWAAIRL